MLKFTTDNVLKTFQSHGHQPIVLLGGGTTRIEIPQEKIKLENLTEKEINKNSKYRKNFKKFLTTKDKKKTDIC